MIAVTILQTFVQRGEAQALPFALMIAAIWPEKWVGQEVRGDVLLDQVLADGIVQPLLLGGSSL